jgi:hypothetical protein
LRLGAEWLIGRVGKLPEKCRKSGSDGEQAAGQTADRHPTVSTPNPETIMLTRKGSVFSALALATCSAFTAAPTWAASDFPAGVYSAKGLSATVTFDDKGELRVMQRGVLKVEAAYAVTGDQIQLTDKRGPWACTKTGEQTGAYHWRFDKGVLVFTKVADQCKDRSDSLTGYAWKKSAP